MDVTLHGISKRFGKTEALKNVSLSIMDGALTAILGPSGCGKTTLLNVVAGVVKQSCGQVFIGGTCVDGYPIHLRRIGYVFQSYALYPTMTAYENIRFPLTTRKYPGKHRSQIRQMQDAAVREMAALLNISDCLDRRPSALSGGQQQRVALARSMVQQPDVMLMDEPFANLDKKLAVQLRDDVRALQKKHRITTLFVTHNQEDALAISDHIVVMRRGEVQQFGPTAEVFADPDNLFTADFLSGSSAFLIQGIAENDTFLANGGAFRVPMPSPVPTGSRCTALLSSDGFRLAAGDAFACEGEVLSSKRAQFCWENRVVALGRAFALQSREELALGARVRLACDSGGIMFFDASEARIR